MADIAQTPVKPFRLGLTMAGAISAGAYTAGVFDFLIEALQEWEATKAKQRASGLPREQWEVPDHDVIISAMSGASAGGMTSALGLLALAGGAKRSDFTCGTQTIRGVLDTLYTAWVIKPRMLPGNGKAGLLGTDDIEASKGAGAISALNGKVLTDIVDGAIAHYRYGGSTFPFIADDLNLFLTTTNLRGVPYKVPFTNSQNQTSYYEMSSHADIAHFKVKGVGSAVFSSPWLAKPPQPAAFPIDMQTIATDGTWAHYSNTALATGAFPIGLPARLIQGVKRGDYDSRRWPLEKAAAISGLATAFTLPTAFPVPARPDADARYVAVDGGVINNEPFELTRWTLMANPPFDNPGDEKHCDTALILIDPFPEDANYNPIYEPDLTLRNIAGAVIGALKSQVRFKADELLDALSGTLYSRYMISPSRTDPETKRRYREAIACGLLGGFGGFAEEAFRQHDYQLGRINCHAFLTRYFSVPASNDIIAAGYGPLLNLPPDDRRIARFTTQGVSGPEYQIIPVLPPRSKHLPWPKITEAQAERIVQASVKRAGAVLKNLKIEGLPSVAISIAWYLLGKSKVEKAIREKLLDDLADREQIAG